MEQAYLLLTYSASFTAVFLITISIIGALSSRVVIESNNSTDIDARKIQLKDTLKKRMFGDFWSKLSRIGYKLSPKKRLNNIEKNLVLAGSPRDLDLDKFLAVKVLLAISTLIIFIFFLIILRGNFSAATILIVSGLFGGFYAPDLYLHRKINLRKKAIRMALPDTLDLLTISVEAGLGFDAALKKVVDRTRGPLADEFRRMLKEIQLGSTRKEAFQNISKRTEVEELDSFILAMLQADIFGISIGKVLRVQASEMRTKRRQEAEEIAMKAPVKIVFPLVFCIFPALLAVVLGPAAISIYESIIRNF